MVVKQEAHLEEPTSAPARPASVVHRVEIVISNLLRFGVTVSLALVVAGTMISFAHHREYLMSPPALRRLMSPGAAFPHSIREVLSGLRELRGQSVVVVGLLLLIATPVLRVAVSIIAFAVQRDRIFVIVTSVVLALLLLSFALGRIEG
jgi:uncharacterized membrane protein